MQTRQIQTDVVVVGAGMSGLAAAVRAQQAGADVIVIEKGPRPGGSMYLSAGIVYTYDSFETARAEVPDGDPALQHVIIEEKSSALNWLEELGVEVREPDGDVTFGSGIQLDPRPFTEHMVRLIEESGGEILLTTPMTELQVEDSRVTGVVAERSDEQLAITAGATVLATGGFQGNEELLQQFVTDAPERMWLRSNPWSTGDGLTVAQDAGARLTGNLSTFYGHNLPAPPAEIPPSQFLEAKQAYGTRAVAVDSAGNRFVDETASPYEVVLTQATAKRAHGRAVYLVDEELYQTMFYSRTVKTSIETAQELGGRVITADSLDELAAALFSWEINGEQAVKTLQSFNEAVSSGEGNRLDPPRRKHQEPIDTPPYRAVEVQPGITFTMGGLDVTTEMQVVRGAGSSSMLQYYPASPAEFQQAVIPGLYAAGMDVGNVMNRQYMGGLMVALVTGRVAGHEAAAS